MNRPNAIRLTGHPIESAKCSLVNTRVGKNRERCHDEECSTMEDDAQVNEASGYREEQSFDRAILDSLEKAIEKHHGADEVNQRRDVAVSETSRSDRRQQQHCAER